MHSKSKIDVRNEFGDLMLAGVHVWHKFIHVLEKKQKSIHKNTFFVEFHQNGLLNVFKR